MELHKKASFDFIRYATCWEDANVLGKALDIKTGEKVLSICSGGDNSFALLAYNPSILVAIDINKVQLHIAELKKVAIQNLSREEVVAFLGYSPSDNRLEVYSKLKSNLSQEALEYWNDNKEIIETGLVYVGKFEKYLRAFAKKVMPFIHSKNVIEELFREKTSDEQKDFYFKKWNTWRWRLFFKIFFSKFVMGRFGRDPQFLKQVKISVSDFILNKAGEHLQSKEAQNNFILRYCLKGEFDGLLPDYLLPENFDNVKMNISKITFFHGYTDEAFDQFGVFDKMNLSNIFEYMDEVTFENTALSILSNTTSNGKLAYWNLMVNRSISNVFPRLSEAAVKPAIIDRGFFYNDFIIENHF